MIGKKYQIACRMTQGVFKIVGDTMSLIMEKLDSRIVVGLNYVNGSIR